MNKKITFLTLIILISIITIIGVPLSLMPPDAALYATISKHMHLNNDFINLYSLGNDWLDKPHLPFWLTALSFKVFGISNFSYKIPGVLIFFMGIWATFKFTKETYNKETALIASIILSTSLHSVISNFDVRAEAYLTGFIIISLYWLYKYITLRKFSYLIIGCFFCSLAVMTKGIFGLIPIIAAIGGHFIVKKEWKEIINPMWIIAFLLIAIFIIPEIYALYLQFDAHPEKIIFGRKNVSGIKFFLWDSQFGRFFNTGPIQKAGGDIFFFLHTIIWAFLPWSLLFYIATFFKIKRNVKKVQQKEEFYSIFAALTSILIFSLSKFQLAHYTNIIFPFMAIITADFIVKLKDKYVYFKKAYSIIQWFLIGISILIIPLLYFIMVPSFNFVFLLIFILCILAIIIVVKNKLHPINRLFYYSAISFCFLYAFMFTHFYPTLFKYQGGVHAAKFINKNLSNEQIYLIDNNGHNFGFEFYLNSSVKRISNKNLSNKTNYIFYVNNKELDFLDQESIRYKIIKTFNSYKITRLKGKFVNKKTRSKTLKKVHLVRLL